jgi:hypothetical protein
VIAIPGLLTIAFGIVAWRIITASFVTMANEEAQRKPGILVREGLKVLMAFLAVLFMFELFVFSLMAAA